MEVEEKKFPSWMGSLIQNTIADTQIGEKASKKAMILAKSDLKEHFERGKDSKGNSWAPPVLRPGGKPLLDKGLLRASMSSGQSHYESSYSTPARVGFTIGSSLPYAAINNFGGVITPKKGPFLAVPLRPFQQKALGIKAKVLFIKQAIIPAREFAYLSAKAVDQIIAIYQEAYQEGIEQRS